MFDLNNPILKAAVKSIVGKIDFKVDREHQLITIRSPLHTTCGDTTVEHTFTYDEFYTKIEELLNE